MDTVHIRSIVITRSYCLVWLSGPVEFYCIWLPCHVQTFCNDSSWIKLNIISSITSLLGVSQLLSSSLKLFIESYVFYIIFLILPFMAPWYYFRYVIFFHFLYALVTAWNLYQPNYYHGTTCQATPASPATASSLRWLRETWRPTLRLAPESAVSRPHNLVTSRGERLVSDDGLFWSVVQQPIWSVCQFLIGKPIYELLNPEDFLASKAAEAKKQAAGWRKGKQECNKQSWMNMSIHIWLLCRWAVYTYIYIYRRTCM